MAITTEKGQSLAKQFPITQEINKADKKRKKFSRSQKKSLAIFCIADFMCYCSMSIMAPFYPKEAFKKGMTETIAGSVFGFYALIIFLASPLFGKIIPKLGVKYCFIGGVVASGFGNILFGLLDFVDDYSWFVALSFLIIGAEALGTSAYSTASYVLINTIFPDDFCFVRGLLEIFVGLGLSAGPAIGGFLFMLGGFQVPFYSIGFIIILLAIFSNYIVEDRVFSEKKKCGSLRSLFKLPSVLVILLTIVVISATWSFLDPTLEPHLRKYELSPKYVGPIFLLLSGMYGLFSPISGWLTDKMDENCWLLIVVGMFFSGISLLLFGLSPIFPVLNSVWWDVGALSALGIFVAFGLLPTYKAILESALCHGKLKDNLETQSLISGLWFSFYSLGEIIGPVSGGALFSYFGFPLTAITISMLNIFASIIVLMYFLCIKTENSKNTVSDLETEITTKPGAELQVAKS